jgi:serine phosphatase RsbU (regulator of sigma subunit)
MPKALIKIHILLYIFIFTSTFLKAQTILELKKEPCPVLIGKYISSYEDKTAKLMLQDVIALPPSQFILSKQDILNFNITKSAIWCKFSITTQMAADWMMEYKNASNNKIDLYLFRKGELLSTQRSGIPYPKDVRKFLGGHILFDLNLKPGDTLDCFLRTEGSGPMVVPLRTAEVRTYFNEDHKLNLLHGMFFGIMLLMVLYNLFLYFTNHNRVYIYYILYIIFSTLFIAFFLGYIYILPEKFLYMFNKFPVLVPAAFGFFGLLFTMDFLNTKQLAPKLHKCIRVFIMLVFIPVFLTVGGFPHESVGIIQLFGIILAVLSFATGLTVFRKGYRPAKFYVIGFGAYMLGLVILIVTNVTHVSIGGFENYALETGSAIEAIMLSFAIGDKLNTATYEKQQAQIQALEALKENEKLIKEQNIILEQKVKERTSELEEQKDIVEEKNKEIVDSINYAKRIQYTLLANENLLKRNLPEHFILFKPKDIVSGDFYWATEKENKFYIAVCDSTGHGVPGAFMSLLNISFLNEALNEKHITAPNNVFNYVRERLIENISQDGAQDGMDAVLLCFDKTNNKISYASANNSLLQITKNGILSHNTDKMPIGKGERTEPFKLYDIHPDKGDIIYLYTDGYADQFGGPKGKKFKYKQLNELLFSNSSKPLNDQKEILNKTFEDWKGNLEQVDDVCVIGIKV